MGLVQGREDSMETSWQEGRAALQLEPLFPFPFLFCLQTRVPFRPSLQAAKTGEQGLFQYQKGENRGY